jgi:hypothetical protein
MADINARPVNDRAALSRLENNEVRKSNVIDFGAIR